jgi:adenylate kinase
MEKYIEENQVYELFEVLMKQLLVAKPERPLDFLIDRLSEEPGKFLIILLFDFCPLL